MSPHQSSKQPTSSGINVQAVSKMEHRIIGQSGLIAKLDDDDSNVRWCARIAALELQLLRGWRWGLHVTKVTLHRWLATCYDSKARFVHLLSSTIFFPANLKMLSHRAKYTQSFQIARPNRARALDASNWVWSAPS